MEQFTEFYQLTKPIEVVNPTSSVDKIYGPYTTMQKALIELSVLGEPGRLFSLKTSSESLVELYVYQGQNIEPTKAGRNLVSADRTLYIDGENIYSNVSSGTQTKLFENAENITFPLEIELTIPFTKIALVTCGIYFISQEYYRIDNNKLIIEDFTERAMIVQPDKYEFIIQGTYFIN